MNRIDGAFIEALRGLEPSRLPSEFRLFLLGENRTSKGIFKLDQAGIDSVLEKFQDQGVDLVIDYEHQTFKAELNGKPAPAAGWFKPEGRADGLWAVGVKWTDEAAEMLSAKKYRYFSPTFEVDKDRRITRLLPMALTNFPASKDQKALVAAKGSTVAAPHVQERSMNVNTIIGLKDDAAESDVEERIVALASLERNLLETTGADTVAAAMGLVIAAKNAATENETLRKSLSEWEERHARDEADQKAKAIDAIVEKAILDGRVSVKDTARIEQLTKHGQTYGAEALQATVAMLQPRPARVYQAPPPGNNLAEQLRAIADYKEKHPGASTADAYIALAAEKPALFAEGGR